MVWTGVNLWHWFLYPKSGENCEHFRGLSLTCLTRRPFLALRMSLRVVAPGGSVCVGAVACTLAAAGGSLHTTEIQSPATEPGHLLSLTRAPRGDGSR